VTKVSRIDIGPWQTVEGGSRTGGGMQL